MSGIVLSASVRQNLLSLQSTASLLATTQNDLATGNKVNSALDNPTNFFTSQALNNRASDIGNLLDSIGNGVQVLQAANTGITSLESLVQSAQSVATQALQTTIGYATKSSFTAALGAGATAANLFGGTTFSSASSSALPSTTRRRPQPRSRRYRPRLTTAANSNAITATIANNDTLTVDGHHHHLQDRRNPGRGHRIPPAWYDRPHRRQRQLTVYIGAGTTQRPVEGHRLATGARRPRSTPRRCWTLGTRHAVTIRRSLHSRPVRLRSEHQLEQPDLLASLGIGSGTATTTLHGRVLGLGLAQRPVDRRGRNRHGDQHHVRHRRQSGQQPQPAEHGAGGEQPAGHGRCERQPDHSDRQRQRLAADRFGLEHQLVVHGRCRRAPIADPAAQATRAGLVSQYNNILSQITTTAQDSSFNGVNLLNGDSLKLVFNETGTSTLSITGTTFNAAGLGLSTWCLAPTSSTTTPPTRC